MFGKGNKTKYGNHAGSILDDARNGLYGQRRGCRLTNKIRNAAFSFFVLVYESVPIMFQNKFVVSGMVQFISVGVQSPTEINAPRGCAAILRRKMSA